MNNKHFAAIINTSGSLGDSTVLQRRGCVPFYSSWWQYLGEPVGTLLRASFVQRRLLELRAGMRLPGEGVERSGENRTQEKGCSQPGGRSEDRGGEQGSFHPRGRVSAPRGWSEVGAPRLRPSAPLWHAKSVTCRRGALRLSAQ